MLNKLREGRFADHKHEIGYFQSRLQDKPLRYALTTGSKIGATVKTVIDDLELQYRDPDAKKTARQKYMALIQGPKPFRDFLADFQHYAAVASISEEQQKEELIDKLTPKLQDALALVEADTLQKLIAQALKAAQALERTQAIRNEVNKRNDSSNRVSIPRGTGRSQARSPVALPSTTIN